MRSLCLSNSSGTCEMRREKQTKQKKQQIAQFQPWDTVIKTNDCVERTDLSSTEFRLLDSERWANNTCNNNDTKTWMLSHFNRLPVPHRECYCVQHKQHVAVFSSTSDSAAPPALHCQIRISVARNRKTKPNKKRRKSFRFHWYRWSWVFEWTHIF